MLELRDNTHIDMVFFLAGEGYDWLAYIYRHGEGPWEATHRIRIVKDNKVWNSQDEKKFWALKAEDGNEATRDGLRQALADVAAVTALTYGRPTIVDTVHVGGGYEAFTKAMSSKSWCNLGRSKPGEDLDTARERLGAEEAVSKAAAEAEA
jgi:hypothetical protein